MLANRLRVRTFLSCSLILSHLPRVFSTISASSIMSQQDLVTARVVFVTCPDEAVAKKLSRGLLVTILIFFFFSFIISRFKLIHCKKRVG